MTAITSAPGFLTHLPPLPIYRFTVDQYHRLIAEGLLTEDDPVELLEGLIVEKGECPTMPEVRVLARPTDSRSADPPLPIWRFRVDQYQRMIDTGILGEDARVELLAGWIVQKMPRNPPHDSAVYRIQRDLFRRLPEEWLCRGQSTVSTEESRPEPDLAVVRGPAERYDDRHPTPQDAALVVEVADSTVRQDRNVMGPLYAESRIPVYWIVNIPDAQVEVYTEPTGPGPSPGYLRRQDYGIEDSVPLVLDGREVDRVPVRSLLPRPQPAPGP